MLQRLVGLETEYAIRFSPDDGTTHPGNDQIYAAVVASLKSQVKTLPGRTRFGMERIFVQNGGSFGYEIMPHRPESGLLEGSTPECRGPRQVIQYQRAQERMLEQAIPMAEASLEAQGFPGRIGLLRNARDVDGNTYGPRENYDFPIARGRQLIFLRYGIVLLSPILLVTTLLRWLSLVPILLLGLATVAIALAAGGIAQVLSLPRPAWAERYTRPGRPIARLCRRFENMAQSFLTWPLSHLFNFLLQRFAFCDVRQLLTAFLVTRPIFSGTGSVDKNGRFLLAKKVPGVLNRSRPAVSLAGHCIYDWGNLHKFLLSSFGNFHAFKKLFEPRQRLQIGLSDANRHQVSEYLKVGTTMMVLELIESGMLSDVPQFLEPLEALNAFNGDPELKIAMPLRGGKATTALETQRWYLERCRAFTKSQSTQSIEAHEILRLWGEALDALEDDPPSLVGRVDWVSKRLMLESAGQNASFAVLKKIDLRYHELSSGYARMMEDRSLAPPVVQNEDIEYAVAHAPSSSPAFRRGRLIQDLADSDLPAWVTWESVKLKQGLRTRVIRLDDYRKDGDR